MSPNPSNSNERIKRLKRWFKSLKIKKWKWDRIIAITSMVVACYAISLSNKQFDSNQISSTEQFKTDTTARRKQFNEGQRLSKIQFDKNLEQEKRQFDSTLRVLKSYQEIADTTLKATVDYQKKQILYDRAILTFYWDKKPATDAFTTEDKSFCIRNIGKRFGKNISVKVIIMDEKFKIGPNKEERFTTLAPNDNLLINYNRAFADIPVKYSFTSLRYKDELLNKWFYETYYDSCIDQKTVNFTPCNSLEIGKINQTLSLNNIKF